MNKKLLAAAIAATVVAAPAAFAESTVYGKMHTSVDAIDYERQNEDNYEMNSRSSRLGFKGSEDLGNGLKAIYQIELSINAGGGTDGQTGSTSGLGGASRNTFVGLAGDWGTFLVGRHDTPAKMAFYAAGTEVLGDSVIDLNLGNNISGGRSANQPVGVFHEYRAENAIAYVSPNFSGFTVVGAVMPGEDNDKGAATGGRDGIADHYSLGAMYSGNGLKASVGYASYDLQSTTPSNPAVDDYEVLQVGASYTLNNFMFGAHYEDTDNFGGAKNTDYTAWALVAKATFGNNAIGAVYTDSETDATGSVNDVDTDGWGLSAEHNFSKRTKVYAAYASGTSDYSAASAIADQDDDVFSLGMIHNF